MRPLPPIPHDRPIVWQQLAQELGGSYLPGDFFTPESLRLTIPPWEIQVAPEPTSLIPITCLRATCQRRRAFFFHLERTNQGTALATNHIAFAQSLLDLPAYREALLTERFTLELEPSVLRCESFGHIADRERLLRLIEIVAETLQRLRDLRLIEG